MTKRNITPEAMPKRPDLPHNRYVAGSQPLDISGVSVGFGTATKPHTYNAPTGEGVTSRRLRRFALTLTRFQLPKAKQYAKSWKLSEASVDSATNIIASCAYREAFSDDPTIGTMNIDVLASLLNEVNPSKEAFMKAYSFIGTNAFDALLAKITNPKQVEYMTQISDSVHSRYLSGYVWYRIKDINSDRQSYRNYARRQYKELAQFLEGYSEHSRDRFSVPDGRRDKNGEKEQDQYGKGKATIAEGTGWYPLYVSKPDLPLNHTGKLGRRSIYTDSGASAKNISRWYTDPNRRIFSRKTKSLGAVVVVDCSGSMSLSDYDIHKLLENTSGATVLCYSTGSRADEEHPNAWIVARKNRQVRRLPDFPGGNGCDAPALRYALTLRENSKQPIVWVTDYGVTGKSDSHNDALVKECKALERRYGIIVMRNIDRAIAKLREMQGKA